MALGVIAEYNPFHNGHAYHIARSRQLSGESAVIAVMSGDFVQRGEPAMFPKRQRVKWALNNGADLVIALSAPFSLACAELFAAAGVRLLDATGLCGCICFGSELADVEALRRAAECSADEPEQISAAIRDGLSRGLPFPRARVRAYEIHLPDIAAALSSPNNLLAVEYLKAVAKYSPGMRAVAVERRGAAHDSPDTQGCFASASALRAMVQGGDAARARSFVPPDVYEDMLACIARSRAPITAAGLSRAAVYALRRMSRDELARLPDATEGLHNLLYSACRNSASLDDVLAAVKSRRYTLARLRRICMCALLGIQRSPKELLEGLYIRVLGVRRDRLELLSMLQQNASLPVIIRHRDVEKLNESQSLLHGIDIFAAETAALGAPEPQSSPSEYAAPLLIV